MPAARKRTGSKLSAATSSTSTAPPNNKKKRGAPVQLEIPAAPKKRGRVLVCGQGDVGQLGLGEDIEETTKFKVVSLLGDKVVDVHAGGMHTIALDCDGKVWTFGCNDEGALGRPTSGEKDEGTPGAVGLPARAVAVAAGDSHSAALLDNGDVYAWGAFRDSHGSMGLVAVGREGKASLTPVRVPCGEAAGALASGGDHLVVLSTSGSVYTMGCGEQGQLGRLSQRSASRDARQGFSALLAPMKVTLKGSACRVWAGYHATFALMANTDKIFAWGLNNYGQLGITGEKRKTALFSPTECDAFSATNATWTSVAAGQHHSLALDAQGQVYSIGRCEYGRLGLGDRSGDAEALEPIPSLQNKKCVSIAAGTSNSFAVTDSGGVFAWGMGSEGQLGTGRSEDCAAPAPASAAAAPRGCVPVAVSAGGQHTVLLVEDPSATKESSPAPEKEMSEEKTEAAIEEEEDEPLPEPEKKKPRPAKRGKKPSVSAAAPAPAVADDQVSSTSSAKPQKVNGDEKKDTAMDVDETDKPQEEEKKETPVTDTAEPEKTQTDTTEDVEMKEESKPETTDTSSQETTASQDSDTKSQEMISEAPEKEVNGEPDIIEPKTVPPVEIPAPLTTTA